MIGWTGKAGPFLSSGGNFYFLAVDSTNDNILRCFKATDPTSSFSEVDSSNRPTVGSHVGGVGAYQVGDTIHIAYQDASGGATEAVSYVTFLMSSDAWGTPENAYTPAGGGTRSSYIGPVDVAVRSDGDVIVFFTGDASQTTMTWYGRIYYSRREGGSWTKGVQVDPNTSWSASPGSVILGTSDKMHFIYSDYTNSDLYGRTLDSSNSLQTAAVIDATSASGTVSHSGKGISFNSSGTIKVRAPYADSSGSSSAKFDSADTISPSTEAFSTNTIKAQAIASSSLSAKLTQMLVDGTDLYVVYVDDTDSDFKWDVATTDGGWGTDTTEYTGTVVGFTANIYERGGYVVLAYLVDDNGTVNYDEIVLRPVATTPPNWQVSGAQYNTLLRM